jgi:metallo-beta-lactamase class B
MSDHHRLARALMVGVALSLMGAASTLAQTAPTPPSKAAAPAACHEDSGWDEPAEPFRVYGNTWYVGTCGISAILVVTPAGDVLIDAGTEAAAPLVEANIRRLGYRLRDVRYILNSHAHLDHVGGLARLQRDSGAQVVGHDAAALARGRGDRSDPQFLSIKGFQPISRVRPIDDSQPLRLGGTAFTAHATPGHTPGSTSWTWTSCEGSRCLNMAYVDSLTAVSDDAYRFSDEAAHPGVVARLRASIATVADLPCDILLTPHPDISATWSRFGPAASAPPVDPAACRRLAGRATTAFDARLAREAAAGGR